MPKKKKMLAMNGTLRLIITLAGAAASLAMTAHAQESADAFAALSANQAREALSSKSFPNFTNRQLCEAAIHADRLDLAAVCFENPATARDVFDATASLGDSPIKDRLLLMMLTRSPEFWGPDAGSFSYGSERDLGDALRVYAPLIRKYLPNVAVSEHLFESSDARAKTAAAIQAVIKTSQLVQKPDPKNNESAAAIKSGESKVQGPSATANSVKLSAKPNQEPMLSTLWGFIVALSAALTGLLCWLLKRRKVSRK